MQLWFKRTKNIMRYIHTSIRSQDYIGSCNSFLILFFHPDFFFYLFILKVHNTWARRCDKTIYMTGPKLDTQYDDPTMPFVYLNITDLYERITEKTIQTLLYVNDNLKNDFDWSEKTI